MAFKEYSLQDANTLEATQIGLEVAGRRPVPAQRPGDPGAGTSTRSWRDGWTTTELERMNGVSAMALLPSEFADLEPFAAKWCLRDRAGAIGRRGWRARWPRCRRSTTRAFPRARGRDRVLRQVPARRHARRRRQPAAADLLVRDRVVPGRAVGPARTFPTPLGTTSTSSRSPRRERAGGQSRDGRKFQRAGPKRPGPSGPGAGEVSAYGYAKPAEGSWTEHYPQLGTEPVSYEDSISPEFYELEREAIFERAWLQRRAGGAAPAHRELLHQGDRRRAARRSSWCAARTARCARSTTSAATAATSSCGRTTRGEETSGTVRQFTCKYHGWRYGPRRRAARSCNKKASSSTSTRPTTGWSRCTATCGPGSSS